jgi:hypothetical protein
MGKGWLSPWAIWDGSEYHMKSDDLSPDWKFPNMVGQVLVSSHSSTPYLRLLLTLSFLNAEGSYLGDDIDLSAALPINLMPAAAQPDYPRSLLFAFNSHAQITEFSITITGVNAKGVAISETFTQVDGWTFETNNAFASVTSCQMTARTGTGAGDTIDITHANKFGLPNNIDEEADVYKIVQYSSAGGSVSDVLLSAVTVNTTFDTVYIPEALYASLDTFVIFYKSNINNMS